MKKASTANPWQTLSSREIYTNPWIRVREDQVINPAGKPGIYGVVEFKPAIGIVPLTENLETYLVGQYRYTLQAYSWEIPEGGGDRGEDVLDGAKRELREETGLRASRWTDLGIFHTSNSVTDETAYCFLAEELEQGQPEPDEDEELRVMKLPFLEVWQMVLKQEITDALTIVCLMRAHEFLRQHGRL